MRGFPPPLFLCCFVYQKEVEKNIRCLLTYNKHLPILTLFKFPSQKKPLSCFFTMTEEELLCAMRDFERIRRLLTITFFMVGFVELVSGTCAILLHSLESETPHLKYPSLVFEGTAVVFASILVFVPLDGARKSCAQARATCAQFVKRPSQIPPIALEQLTTANTLWFRHPMSRCVRPQTTHPPPLALSLPQPLAKASVVNSGRPLRVNAV